ncbi:MAG: zf-TFIIB domain-containing protein [Litoreibacter sp.]|nr:zf-TFIIB domain-containing protein [Litoreibacter sp.]MCY4333683.1 zf-TFIIB domain-containing protein [Litoreibacter sp.]
MPLMTSPIDGTPMREVERYGVKMDICPTSGGIWLDRGELEKIIMAIREEALVDGGVAAEEAYSDVHYHESPQRAQQTYPKRRKRSSMFDNLLDIFD